MIISGWKEGIVVSVRNCSELGENQQKIMRRLMANDRLVNLLYYADEDPFSHPPLTTEQKRCEIFNKLIKIVPRIGPKEDERSFIAITIDKGDKISSNTEFRTVRIVIENFVPLTAWIIKDTNLRPFAIMGEIEESLEGKVVNGLGRIEGGDFELNFLTDEIGSYKQTFWIVNYD